MFKVTDMEQVTRKLHLEIEVHHMHILGRRSLISKQDRPGYDHRHARAMPGDVSRRQCVGAVSTIPGVSSVWAVPAKYL